MQFITIALVAALTALSAAQDLSSLPTCAQGCVGDGLTTTGCNGLDIACVCRSQTWISKLSCCIAKGCSTADQQTTIGFADALCQTTGATLPKQATCDEAGVSSAASSAASSASAVSTATGSILATTSTPATATSGSATVAAGSSISSVISSINSVASSVRASATPTAAANRLVQGMGAAGAAGAAAFAIALL